MTADARRTEMPADLLRAVIGAPDAATAARAAGITPVLLGDDLGGEARDLGGAHAALAIACARGGESALVGMREAVARGVAHVEGSITLVAPPPLVLLSGGWTTVSEADARAGADAALEYLLGLAVALDGHPRVWALATGGEPAAGASVAPDTLARARTAGRDPIAALARHEAAGLFAALGDLVPPGAAHAGGESRAVLIR